ncbi:MAG: diphthamide synthesis protein [Nanoarchaeota archaeon]|nr:diphthamide synthesis protein [Nanoarchaeota archaeon]
MKHYTLRDLDKKYDMELKKVVKEVKKKKPKLVLLQFPDGLKPYATAVVDYLEEETKAEYLIWLGSCFGACDFPTGLEYLKPKIDLMVQFGHSALMPSY